MESISKITQTYIDQHPQIKECLARNLINTSELARQISKETKLTQFNAIMVSANRYAQKLKPKNKDKEILKLLKKSSLHIKSKVCIFIFISGADIYDNIEPIHIIKGISSITAVYDQEHYETVSERYEHFILDKEKDLVEVALVSPAEADTVPGITAMLTGLLADSGVNVLTVLGSYTDDVFIIKKEDLSKANTVLERVVG